MSERAIPHVRKFLGQGVRELRKQRRLSQEGLCDHSALSGKFIGEVERCEKSISIDSLYRVAVALKVPLSLLTDVGTARHRVPNADAEKILALVSGGHRRAQIRRDYEVLRAMLGTRVVRNQGRHETFPIKKRG